MNGAPDFVGERWRLRLGDGGKEEDGCEVAGAAVGGGWVGWGWGCRGGGVWAGALSVVSDGDSSKAAKDVLLGVLRAPVEAEVRSWVSAGPGVSQG